VSESVIQFGLREHLATIFRHRWKIILVFIGAVGVAGAYAFLSSSVYVAATRLVILDQDPSQRLSGAAGASDFVFSPQEQVLTQVEIAASPQLVERAAQRLGPELVVERLTWRWDWLREIPGRVKERVLATAAAFPQTRAIMDRFGLTPTPKEPGSPLDAAREKIDAALFVDAIPKTDMFVIAVEAPDPAFAADIVNTLVDVYTAHLAELRRPVRVAELAEEEAARLTAELRRAETRAQVYAEANGIVSIDAQQDLLLGRLSEAETQLATAEREQLEAQRNIESLRSEIEELPAQIQTSTVTRRNPAADQLLDRIATLEGRAARFVPGSPAAASLQTEIAAVRTQLRNVSGEISEAETTAANQTLEDLRTRLVLQRADSRALAVRVETLRAQIIDLKGELRRLDGHEIAYRERAREAEAKQEALRYALQRQEETRISERLARASLSRVVPVGPALIPLVPERPRRKITLILGAVVGLAGGVGLAYALEFMRRTMTTREEVEAVLGYPAVASFLKARRRRGKAYQFNRIECRNLINMIADLRSRQRAVTLLVASARGREGRSYVAERLAQELRDEGATVLLIGVEQAPAKMSSPPQDTAQDTASLPADRPDAQLPAVGGGGGQLDAVRFSGPPADTHSRLGAMLDDLRDRHDVVIIDSLPVESCPEQLRIVGRVDSVVFVVEAERTPVFAARRCVRAFEDAGVRALGIVLNKRRFQIPGWVYHRLLRPA
jgi:uncharacterized protein involved in exopolysaccharide biosynthesis